MVKIKQILEGKSWSVLNCNLIVKWEHSVVKVEQQKIVVSSSITFQFDKRCIFVFQTHPQLQLENEYAISTIAKMNEVPKSVSTNKKEKQMKYFGLVEVSLDFEDWQHIVYWQKFQLERVDNSGPGAKLRVSLSSATTHPYLCYT